MFQQQSHHCGIETNSSSEVGSTFGACSNRTIVGLKLQKLGSVGRQTDKQQSHHCGIETLNNGLQFVTVYARSNRTIVGLKLTM